MNNWLLTVLKVTALSVYILALLSLEVSILGDYDKILRWVAIVLIAGHLGEYLWVRKRLSTIPGSYHFINTLLFGFLYWLPLFKQPRK